jgi:glutamine synthetase
VAAYSLEPLLRADVAAGTIDTVLVAFPDMQGRLIGKRFHAEFFLEGAIDETHGCNYLLADDIDMEPVPGYAAASWGKGYGDFVMKPDLDTLMKCTWLEGTALVHRRRPRPSPPRTGSPRPAQCAEAQLEAPRSHGPLRQFRVRARVLSLRRDL